jgi:hypothetical protein
MWYIHNYILLFCSSRELWGIHSPNALTEKSGSEGEAVYQQTRKSAVLNGLFTSHSVSFSVSFPLCQVVSWGHCSLLPEKGASVQQDWNKGVQTFFDFSRSCSSNCLSSLLRPLYFCCKYDIELQCGESMPCLAIVWVVLSCPSLLSAKTQPGLPAQLLGRGSALHLAPGMISWPSWKFCEFGIGATTPHPKLYPQVIGHSIMTPSRLCLKLPL